MFIYKILTILPNRRELCAQAKLILMSLSSMEAEGIGTNATTPRIRWIFCDYCSQRQHGEEGPFLCNSEQEHASVRSFLEHFFWILLQRFSSFCLFLCSCDFFEQFWAFSCSLLEAVDVCDMWKKFAYTIRWAWMLGNPVGIWNQVDRKAH